MPLVWAKLSGLAQIALYSTDDGSRQGFSLHVGKKNINKISWPADVGGKKNRKGKIDRFSVKMGILEEKRTTQE